MAKKHDKNFQLNTSQWPKLDPGTSDGFEVSGDLFITGALHVAGSVFGNLDVGPNSSKARKDSDATAVLSPERGNDFLRGVQAIKSVTFSDSDEDQTRKRIKIGFRPNFLIAFSTITSRFDPKLNLKPYGGMTGGFATLNQEKKVPQRAIGPVIHLTTDGSKIKDFRSSALGPNSIQAPGSPNVKNQNGVAIALLQHNDTAKDLILVRAKKVDDVSVTFELRKSRLQDTDRFNQFDLECHIMFFG